MVDGAFDAAKKAMIGENSMDSLVGTLLSREEPEEMTREEYEYTIKWAAGSLYGGMCDTDPLCAWLKPLLSWNRIGKCKCPVFFAFVLKWDGKLPQKDDV